MDKRFLAIIVVITGIFIGFLVFNKEDTPPANPTNHVVGSNKYTVKLIEYGDFECPACGQYYPIVKQLKEQYGEYFEFQFRHFPLDQLHPNARAAHRAAEAAGNQGKFFEMHDLLYEGQASWKNSPDSLAVFTSYATQLSLDTTRFNEDMRSSLTNAIINADVKEAQAAGGTGTPTFVLNGKKIENSPRDLEGFIKLIEDAAKEKDSSVTLPRTPTPTQSSEQIENTQTQAPPTE